MKYSDICEHCGNIKTAYVHNLNGQLVDALAKLCDHYWMTNRSYMATELDLTHIQINNFQKLQYFGLVEHSVDGWKPTDKGMGFIRGKTVVYNKVATYGREILSNDHIVWSTTKNKPKLVHIGAIDDYQWKPKMDYQLEKARGSQMVLI